MYLMMNIDNDPFISKKEFRKYFKGANRSLMCDIGYTVLDYQRALLECSTLPFRSLDREKKNIISTKHFKRWFDGKTRDPQTKAVYKKFEKEIKQLQKQKDITFWEWMSFICPVGRPSPLHFCFLAGDFLAVFSLEICDGNWKLNWPLCWCLEF